MTILAVIPFSYLVENLDHEDKKAIKKHMIVLVATFYVLALHELVLCLLKYFCILVGFIIMCPLTLILVIHLGNNEDSEENAAPKPESKLTKFVKNFYSTAKASE